MIISWLMPQLSLVHMLQDNLSAPVALTHFTLPTSKITQGREHVSSVPVGLMLHKRLCAWERPVAEEDALQRLKDEDLLCRY